jgi:tripartite-type tricarboxylate transporter receptor subunit TctC
MHRKLAIAFALLALGVAAPAGAADPYPTKPLRLTVGFAAGGPTDIPARFLADKLGALLGQSVVVENKPGTGGLLGTRYALGQPRDGHHLLLCTHFEAMNTLLYKSPAYMLADIAPVALIAKYYYGLALSKALPVESFRELMDYARSRPGEVSYATIGVGSPSEILALQLEKSAGVRMNKIPFRSTPQIFQEMVAGRVHLFVSPTLAALSLYRGGQIKLIAVTSAERMQDAPEVPALIEQGARFEPFGWLGICAGAGTPEAVLDLLNRHVAAIVATAEYRELIEKGGSIPVSSTRDELAELLGRTVAAVASTVREHGLQQEE